MKFIKLIIAFLAIILTPIAAFAAEEGGVAPHMTWRIIDFIVFAAILYYFFKNPIASYFKNRKEEIKNSFEEAEKLKAEAEELLKETEEKLSKLNAEIDKLVGTFKSIAEHEKESIIQETKSILERIKENIEEEKASMMNRAKLELLTKITHESIESLRRKMSALTEDKHSKINKKFIGSIT